MSYFWPLHGIDQNGNFLIHRPHDGHSLGLRWIPENKE